MSVHNTLQDLLNRVTRAEYNLGQLIKDAERTNSPDVSRLNGKQQGVALVRSYIEEVMRPDMTPDAYIHVHADGHREVWSARIHNMHPEDPCWRVDRLDRLEEGLGSCTPIWYSTTPPGECAP